MKRILFLIVAIFLYLYLPAQNILRLGDAVNTALKNSLDIQLVKNNLQSNTIYNNYGIAGGLPLVTGSVTDQAQLYNINQHFNTGTVIQTNGAGSNNLTVGVAGSILLYNGQRVVTTKKRLEQLQKQSANQLNAEIQQIMYDVMTGYYDVVRQQGYIKTIDRSIEAAQKKLSVVQTRQDVGLANNADLFQAQLDLNELLQSKKTQELVINQASTELKRLMTLQKDTAFIIADSIVVDSAIILDSVLNDINRNPTILAAEDQIKINEFLVKETAAQKYPSIRANTGYNFSRNNASAGQLLLNQNYGPYVGLSVGIPIYNGSIYKRQEKVAAINQKNAVLQKDILIRDFTSLASKYFQSYKDALSQLEMEKANYKLSAQLLDLVLQRFQLKQATIIDVKNAQQSFEASGYRLINLSYAAKLAEIGMKKLQSKLSI